MLDLSKLVPNSGHVHTCFVRTFYICLTLCDDDRYDNFNICLLKCN